MIEYRTKSPFKYKFHYGRKWIELNDLRNRMACDFEFDFCEYKIGDTVFRERSDSFNEAFNREVLWEKLRE